MPVGARAPQNPVVYGLPPVVNTGKVDPEVPKRSRAQRRKVAKIEAEINRRVNNGWPTGALRTLDAPSSRTLLTSSEVVEAYTLIARGYFRAGADDKADRKSVV